MATIDKNETLMYSSADTTINFDYNMSIGVTIKDLPSTSQTAFMAAAFDILETNGYEIGEPAHAPFGPSAESSGGAGFGLEITGIKINPLSCTSARAQIVYGTPVIPATTFDSDGIKWIWETSSTVRAEPQAWDKSKIGIKTKYWPKVGAGYMDAGVWAQDDNVRRYQQSHTATKYRPWVTATARARIRYDWIQFNPDWHPNKLQYLLAGKVNNDLYPLKPTADNDATRGVWMCQGVQVSTPNNGIIWDVRVTFGRNDYGWETVIIYEDPNNSNKIPADIADRITATAGTPGGFTKPYPIPGVPSNRILQNPAVADTDTGGAIRPQMVELYDFSQTPLNLDLLQVS